MTSAPPNEGESIYGSVVPPSTKCLAALPVEVLTNAMSFLGHDDLRSLKRLPWFGEVLLSDAFAYALCVRDNVTDIRINQWIGGAFPAGRWSQQRATVGPVMKPQGVLACRLAWETVASYPVPEVHMPDDVPPAIFSCGADERACVLSIIDVDGTAASQRKCATVVRSAVNISGEVSWGISDVATVDDGFVVEGFGVTSARVRPTNHSDCGDGGLRTAVFRLRESPAPTGRQRAHALQTLLSLSSNVTLCGSKANLRQWFRTAAMEMTDFDHTIAALHTQSTVPDLTVLLCDDNQCEERNCASSASTTTLCELFDGCGEMMQKWLVFRTGKITIRCGTDAGTITPKPYFAPQWLGRGNGSSSVGSITSRLTASDVTRLFSVALKRGITSGGWWDQEVLELVSARIRHEDAALYENAMRTEFREAARHQKATNTIPMTTLVELHDHFYFSILRRHAFQLSGLVGCDTEMGLILLDLLKRDINLLLRKLWQENSDASRAYNNTVIDRVMDPVHAAFVETDLVYAQGSGSAAAVKQWHKALQQAIKEYKASALGPRVHDVLHEYLQRYLSPVQEHPLASPALKKAAQGLNDTAVKELLEWRNRQDKLNGNMQKDCAVYTTHVGFEWTASLHSAAADHYRATRAEMKHFEAMALAKLSAFSEPLAEFVDDSGYVCLCLDHVRNHALGATLALERRHREEAVRVAARLPEKVHCRENYRIARSAITDQQQPGQPSSQTGVRKQSFFARLKSTVAGFKST